MKTQFNLTNPPKPGDKVILRYNEGPFTVKRFDKREGKVDFTDRDCSWYLYHDTTLSHCTLHEAAPLAAPVQPTAKMTAAVLDLLKSKGSLTALEAQGVLRCRSLSKRISELKRLGWSISRELKEDTTGQRYARYSLEASSLTT